MTTLQIRTTANPMPAEMSVSAVFSHAPTWKTGILTVDRPESHHGLPVLVLEGQAMGPADWPYALSVDGWQVVDGVSVHDGAGRDLIVAAERAGYRINVV